MSHHYPPIFSSGFASSRAFGLCPNYKPACLLRGDCIQQHPRDSHSIPKQRYIHRRYRFRCFRATKRGGRDPDHRPLNAQFRCIHQYVTHGDIRLHRGDTRLHHRHRLKRIDIPFQRLQRRVDVLHPRRREFCLIIFLLLIQTPRQAFQLIVQKLSFSP